MKIKLLFFTIILFLVCGTGYGQILTFEFNGINTAVITAPSTFNNSNLNPSTISRGAGLTAVNNTNRFNSQQWSLTNIINAIANDDYVEFTITPNTGFQFSVSSMVFNIQRSATSLRGIALRSSADNYASNLDSEKAIADNTDITEVITFTFTQTNSSTTVTYRLYGWAEQTGGSGGMEGTGNDIVVNGTVTAAPATPTLSGTPTSLTGFNYNVGSGPSAVQDFTLTGNTLNGSDVTITASDNYEIKDSAAGSYGRIITYTAYNGTSRTINVRLKPSLPSGSYHSENIIISGGGAPTINVACSGTVSPTIITFDFFGFLGNEATANSNFNNLNLTASTISRGTGVTATTNGNRFNAQEWSITTIADAVTNNEYIEFTITPNAGYQFSVSSMVYNMQRSPAGLRGIALRSSADNYASNLDGEKAIADNDSSTEIITFTFAQANSIIPVTYRLYGYAETTAGTGGMEGTGNDIVVNGMVTASPATPTIYTSVATATGYIYNAGSGPSTSQTFNLNGINLTGFTSDLTLSAVGTNYEVSTNNISFGESRTVSYTSATLTSTPVYIRLKAGLLVGSYNSENISISGGGATTINVACSGTVSPTIISFDFLGLLGNEATANSNFNNLNLTASTISRGSGVTATTNGNRFNAQEWSISTIADAVTNNEYIEFTITPNSGYQFSVSSMVYNIQRSPTGLRGIALRSSADNYASNLDSEKAIPDIDSSTEIITFSFAQANSIIPVTYRLYGYAETTAGTGGMEGTGNDIVVNGTVTQVTLATDYFRSKVTGDWEIATSWESSLDNISWIVATLVPTNTANTITILNGQNINVNSAVTAGSVIVNSGGTLTLRGNNTLELKSGGTFTINNGGTVKIQNTNGFSGSPTTAISSYNSPSITLNAGSTVEYAGTNQTITPSGYSNLTISGIGLKILADTSEVLVSNELKVTAGTLQIDGNKLLTVTNAINNTSGNPIVISNNGNLVQLTEVDNATANANTGNIKMTRTSRLMADNDYIYWGSPVKENILLPTSQIPTNFDSTYQWDLTGVIDGAWNALSSIVPGRGFITKVASGVTTATDFDFTGTPNNGTVNVTANGYDTNFNLDTTGNTILLANPYPSALDATKFVEANNSILDGTLYFWTSSTANAGGAYSNNDYATWNKMGGTATAPPPSKPLDTSLKPAGTIAAGQGFFADIHADGNITFTNAMRERTTSGNSQFFKTTKSNKTKSERHRIWLNLTNQKNAFRQILVGYISDATNGFDRSFDGEAFTDNEINIYSILEDKTLVIQGRAVPFNNADIVPLGVSITNRGQYTIAIDEVDGLFTNQEIYLEDKLLGVVHLLNSPYTFNTTAGTFNDRFVLRYTSKTLGANDAEILDNQVLVSIKNKLIKVNSKGASIDKVSVYDLVGRQLFNKDKVNSTLVTISNLSSAQQTFVLKISLQNGNVITKKIIF